MQPPLQLIPVPPLLYTTILEPPLPPPRRGRLYALHRAGGLCAPLHLLLSSKHRNEQEIRVLLCIAQANVEDVLLHPLGEV